MDRPVVNRVYKGRDLSEWRIAKAQRGTDGVVIRAVVTLAKMGGYGGLKDVSRAAGFKSDTGSNESLVDAYIYGLVDVGGKPEVWTLTEAGWALAKSTRATDVPPVAKRTFPKSKRTGKHTPAVPAVPAAPMAAPSVSVTRSEYPVLHAWVARMSRLEHVAMELESIGESTLAGQTREAINQPQVDKAFYDDVIRLVDDLGGI